MINFETQEGMINFIIAVIGCLPVILYFCYFTSSTIDKGHKSHWGFVKWIVFGIYHLFKSDDRKEEQDEH